MSAPILVSFNGHPEECICVPCMNADFNAHLVSVGMDPSRYADGNGENVAAQRTRYAAPGQRSGRGYVRLVSERQVRFIKSLLSSRDTRNLVRLPGSEDIERMSLTGARDLIDRLLACPMLPDAPRADAPSDKQLAYLRTLIEERVIEGPAIDVDSLTRREASRVIDMLRSAPRKPRVTVATPGEAPRSGALTLGMYRHDDGRIVRTQRAKAGHLYGKQLDRDAGDAWVYAPGALTGLTEAHRMSLADVNALSIELGSCCCCSRTLTATVNGVGPAARVIGPICAAKYGYA